MKINQRIEIVSSTRSGWSSMGPKPRESVRQILAQYYTSVEITIVNDLADLEALVARRPDLVFLGMKKILTSQDLGLKGTEKIWLGEYFDAHGITYTGSNHLAHELEVDKALAKHCALDAGLRTAPFYVVVEEQFAEAVDSPLGYPVFIKPTNLWGGQGVDDKSVARDFAQLTSKIRSLAVDLHADSLIEKYLSGREFSVAILEDEATTEMLVMPIELIAPADKNGSRLLSAEVKSADTERSIAVTDGILKSRVCDLAIKIFHALGARDYARIDIRLDELGNPHFLEANLMPSLKQSEGNYFPKACLLNLGMDYEEMVLSIARLALTRGPAVKSEIEQTGLQIFRALESVA